MEDAFVPHDAGTLERRIAAAIAAEGYAIAHDFMSARDAEALRATALAHDRAGDLAPAAIGRGARRAVREAIRGDRIRWIAKDPANPAEQRLLQRFEALRAALNRDLQLGLFELEAHYAIYSAGTGYARHIDRFRDDDARVVSLVLYLNSDWQAHEGGALRLAVEGADVDVLPHAGTLVAFLSDRHPHEVRPATRERVSIAGWFRRRA